MFGFLVDPLGQQTKDEEQFRSSNSGATRSNPDDGNQPPDTVVTQLAAIAKKLESIDDVESSRHHQNQRHHPHNKIAFPTFSDGDPRGWILKVEKYFRYYDILEDETVDVVSMHLEGDALDLYSWLSTDQTNEYWEDLARAPPKTFGPTEFQNLDEYLQTGTVQEYRQEFSKHSSRVSNWPKHCLLEVFLNGLKKELKCDVRIHKPTMVQKAVSIALEFE
ncbi:hypothetical protein LXL04_016275 [Taraxacum kok-saghyz]